MNKNQNQAVSPIDFQDLTKSSLWEDYLPAIYALNDVEVFPHFALDAALAVAEASSGSFFLWDEVKKEFLLKAVRGAYRDRVGTPHIKLREGILGWVGGEGASVLVKDIQEDQRFQTVKRSGNYRSLSFMSLPLIAGNRLLGVINITERDDLVPFSEEDFRRSQSLARHIACAYAHLRLVIRLQDENTHMFKELDQLKRQVKEQEVLVSLGKLAANLTHELNNPLDAIRRYVNLAFDQSLEQSVTKEYLLKARKAIRRAIRVIRHLMLFTASQKDGSKTSEIHALIHQSLETISQDPAFKMVQIRTEFQAPPAWVKECGLGLVFQNLYQNARQAMNGEGQLIVRTERSGDQVVVSVEDTGCGIPEELFKKLFDPFVSTKQAGKGMGLGLTICRDIVERCGGRISCESLQGKGVRFMLVLPCQTKGETIL